MTYEKREAPNTKQPTPHHRNDPMHPFPRSPAKDKQTRWDKETPQHQRNEPLLRLSPLPAVELFRFGEVEPDDENQRREYRAGQGSQKSETDLAGGETVDATEDDGEGFQEAEENDAD